MNFWWNMKNCTVSRLLGLCLAIYTPLCYTSENTSIIIQYNTKAILPCTALSHSKHYAAFTWYKQLPNEEGIIRKLVNKNSPQIYKNYENRTDVFLTGEGSLVLMNVNYSQAGKYKCYVAGKVGHRNNDSYVFLTVTESATETTPYMDATTTVVLHSTKMNSSTLDLVHPVDVSLLSILVGFFSITLSKGLLGFACVWGMATYNKHQRRKLWS